MPASIVTVVILLNGVPVDFGNVPPHLKPFLKDGVVIVPVRPVLEGVGAKVSANVMGRGDWDEVWVAHKGKEIGLRKTYQTEYTKALQQLEHITWPAKDKLSAEHKYSYIASTSYREVTRAPGKTPEKTYRLMMPLGFLSQTFGFSVQWDAVKKLVKIETSE